jgi:hypothetical protein
VVSPETTAGILGALRAAEAGAAADTPGAFVALPGCTPLYASLLAARAAPPGASPGAQPGPGWAVPAAAAAALGDVYARAQAALGRAGAARGSGEGPGRPAAAREGGSPGDAGDRGGRREQGDADGRDEREDEGGRRGGGGGGAAAARAVLEAARDVQAVPRLCRCLEDCAGDPGAGAASAQAPAWRRAARSWGVSRHRRLAARWVGEATLPLCSDTQHFYPCLRGCSPMALARCKAHLSCPRAVHPQGSC